MKVTGRCHCGAIAYEARVDPGRVVVCHCRDCQRLSGSAYRVSVGTTRGDFTLRRGAPTVYVKTADSGARRAQAFCGACGSPLFTYDLARPESLGLRIGCLDQRDRLLPARQIWCDSAWPGTARLAGVPGHPRE